MSLIKSGKELLFLPNEAEVMDSLKAGTYRVVDGGMSGRHLLQEDNDFVIGDQPVFGGRQGKVDVITKTYESNKESLGVLLSGDKGIGKTLFSRMLSTWAHDNDVPVVIIDEASGVRGIANYVDQLPENILVMFDEFEKNFDNDDQQQFLGLFDGMSNKKRMYVITVNSVYELSEFMRERPGRLLFHIRFDYPDDKEVEEYLSYYVKDISEENISIAKALASMSKVNYDILNAMVKMLLTGFDLKDVLPDLNIATPDSLPDKQVTGTVRYTINGISGETDIYTTVDMEANALGRENNLVSFRAVTGKDEDDGTPIKALVYLAVSGIKIKGKSVSYENSRLLDYHTDEELKVDYVVNTALSIKQDKVSRIDYTSLI